MTMTVPKPIVSILHIPYKHKVDRCYYVAAVPVIGYEMWYRDVCLNITRGVYHKYVSPSEIRLNLNQHKNQHVSKGFMSYWKVYIHLSGRLFTRLGNQELRDAQEELRIYIRGLSPTVLKVLDTTRIMGHMAEIAPASPYTPADGKPVDLTDPPPNMSVSLRIPEHKIKPSWHEPPT